MAVDVAGAESAIKKPGTSHPVLRLLGQRVAWGVVTLLLVSVLVFAATAVLPGNAARAVLGQDVTPARLHALEAQLHLNVAPTTGYWRWFSRVVRGDMGTSLTSRESVASLIGPRVLNSAVLVLLAGVIATSVGVSLGLLAAARKDRLFDSATSVVALVMNSVPEYVVAIVLVMLFSTVVLPLFPGVSTFPPGSPPWDHPSALVLPVATLVLLVTPYIFRMTRATMIEALESDYAEMARLKGVSPRRLLLVHALPNCVPAIVQVVALNLLYLAGGIVVIEYVFNYQGVGQALVGSVSNRDVPVIQCLVLILAAFYVAVNIASDLVALLATPRRRLPRSG